MSPFACSLVGRTSDAVSTTAADAHIKTITHVVQASLSRADTLPAVQHDAGNTLIIRTPEEGRQLAIKMARLIIKSTQPDAAVRKRRAPPMLKIPA